MSAAEEHAAAKADAQQAAAKLTDEELADAILEAEQAHDHQTFWDLVEEQVGRDVESTLELDLPGFEPPC